MTCLALICGIVWGVFRFKAERNAEVAETKIEQSKQEAQRLQVETQRLTLEEQKARHEVSQLDSYTMNVQVNATSARSPSVSNAWILAVEVTLKNTGKAEFRADLGRGQFYASRFEGMNADGTPVYGPRRNLKVAFPDNVYPTISAPPDGQPRILHSLTEVYAPGLYVVRFRVDNSASTILASEAFVSVGNDGDAIPKSSSNVAK